MEKFDLNIRLGKNRLREFSNYMKKISHSIGFRVSSRGWCYILEQKRLINKDDFDKCQDAIIRCVKSGFLPVDFLAQDPARKFKNVYSNKKRGASYVLDWMLGNVEKGAIYTNPKWFEGEEYYIQVLVEKIDLVTLWEKVCDEYKIPICNGRGWQSVLQRAEYCKRFKKAEERGQKCVLLIAGDFDPDGIRITDGIRKNLEQVSDIIWSDGTYGYDPSELIIERFSINRDHIEDNNLTWIDNLITGSKKNLADPRHPNYKLPYLQNYLRDVGVRKCEANALVVIPDVAAEIIREKIEEYYGEDASERFKEKKRIVEKEYRDFLNSFNVFEMLKDLIEEKEDDGEEEILIPELMDKLIEFVEETEDDEDEDDEDDEDDY